MGAPFGAGGQPEPVNAQSSGASPLGQRRPLGRGWRGARRFGLAGRRLRQLDDERRAGAGGAFGADRAAARVDDLARDREPETRAVLAGGEEGLEDARQIVRGDAAAGVAY